MFGALMWTLGRGLWAPSIIRLHIHRYSQQGGCCLDDIGVAKSVDSVEPTAPASTCASRMRSTLFLLEGLLDILVETDENAVVWEPEVGRQF